MGRIGHPITKICRLAFNMKILYFDKFDYPEYEKKYQCKKVSLNEILKCFDIISMNLPYLPKIYHLVSEEQLELMKKRSFFN